jgi:hypothetical protein
LKVAVEVERTRKSKKRLDEKLLHYRRSSFSHVIYYCSSLELAQLILKQGSLDPKLAVGEMHSPLSGYTREGEKLPVLEFFRRKVNQKQSLSFKERIQSH